MRIGGDMQLEKHHMVGAHTLSGHCWRMTRGVECGQNQTVFVTSCMSHMAFLGIKQAHFHSELHSPTVSFTGRFFGEPSSQADSPLA
jgi:hypothetical protein